MRTQPDTIKLIECIITHPGVFHADEVCAVAYLRMATGINIPVHRRVPTDEELSDPKFAVLDVGGRHEPELNNFDHHQRGGAGERWDTDVPFSSFGLVADRIVFDDLKVAAKLDESLISAVDAADNGFGASESGKVPFYSFSRAVSGFNPIGQCSPKERDLAFEKAVAFATQVIENAITSAIAEVEAEKEVLEAYTKLDGRVLVLEKFVPWQGAFRMREDEANLLFIVFPSERGGWMLQQLPIEGEPFKGRLPLLEGWAGLREKELRDLSGVEDATFVHPGRFCGGAGSLKGALKMAELTMQAAEVGLTS